MTRPALVDATPLDPPLLGTAPLDTAPIDTAPPAPADPFLGALAGALAARRDLWEPRARYRTSSRWTSLLEPADVAAYLDPALAAVAARAQIWLLTWLPGQGTPLHDHGSSGGALAVARGTLSERVVAARRGGQPHEEQLAVPAGRLRLFGARYVHQVTNAETEPAVSVHVYAPRLRVMNTYRVDDAGLHLTGTERAGVDW